MCVHYTTVLLAYVIDDYMDLLPDLLMVVVCMCDKSCLLGSLPITQFITATVHMLL